jgi:hypothetical protein
MILKKLFFFYVVLLLPAVALIILVSNNIITKTFVAYSTYVYIFIYHPLICAARLIQLGILKRSELYKPLNPFWSNKHYKMLFFNSNAEKRHPKNESLIQ